MNAIDIQSVHKSYANVKALNGLNLHVKKGEFFGLLGPNGAGKTTLIHSIMGLVRPNNGKIFVMGNEVRPESSASRQCLGFSPQEVNVDRFFNLRKTLEFQAGFYGYPKKFAKARAEELLEQFRLTDKASLPFYKLSGGMQKRLLIARALMSKPQVLILDEPSAGIDVEQRRELWDYLQGLNRDGTTIVLTTHYIDEAEFLCERVAIIRHGQIIEEGSPRALIEKHGEQSVEIQLKYPVSSTVFSGLENVEVRGSVVSAKAAKIGPLTGEILQRALAVSEQKVLDLQVKHGSLEEVFVALTGEKINADQVLG